MTVMSAVTTYRTCPRSGLQFEAQAERLILPGRDEPRETTGQADVFQKFVLAALLQITFQLRRRLKML